MADLKNLDKNVKKIIDWVSTADIIIMEIDKNLKSNISDVENLKKITSNLKDYDADINLLKSVLEKSQIDTDNLHNSLILFKKQQNCNIEEIRSFLMSLKNEVESLKNSFVCLNNKLENIKNSLTNDTFNNIDKITQTIEIHEGDNEGDNSDIKNDNNMKKQKKLKG